MNADETLALGRALLAWGVPVIVCRPSEHPDSQEMIPVRSWRTITCARDCGDLSEYRHGTDALALIGGHGIDVIDVDTKSEGSIEPFGAFEHFGVTRTPSGGAHYLVSSTGVGKVQGLTVRGSMVGDYVGGRADGSGRLIAYLPGSHRPNKYPGIQYLIEEPWDIEGAVLGAANPKIVELLEEAGGTRERVGVGPGDSDGYVDDSPERDPSDGVHPYVAAAVARELERLDDLRGEPWAPGAGWDSTTYEVACSLLRFANSRWSGYSADDALADLLEHAPRDNVWGASEARAKWRSAQASVGLVGRRPPGGGAGDDFDAAEGGDDDPRPQRRPEVDVSNSGETLAWARRRVGSEGTPLAGLFLRSEDLVYTPRVGEEGYVPPVSGDDGSMQIRHMGVTALCGYIDARYRVFKTSSRGVESAALFPTEVGARISGAPALLSGVRPIRGVTHTPIVRADGSVLSAAGYDPGSRMLYLPDRGLHVPEHESVDVIREMLCDFQFENEHHRMNYLAALLTPLIREVVPPPYPMLVISAHNAGAGKSLIASLLRIIHGGVFRGEMVREKEEFRKQITSILWSTTAPVVTFDNLTGTLRSTQLDALLTSSVWSDRPLGVSESREMVNDRLWAATGNNLTLGGDMRRRVNWCLLDPGVERPELRTRFAHPRLEQWVADNRGRVLAALLGAVQGWVAAGRPLPPARQGDSYAAWQQTVQGVLAHAGFDGVVGHTDSVREDSAADDDEWAGLVRAIFEVFGTRAWRVNEVMEAFTLGDIDSTVLPDDVLARVSPYDHSRAAKALGWRMRAGENRWEGGLTIVRSRQTKEEARRRGTLWQVRVRGDDLL